ncbi:VOC family protein [Bradyrhizobium sp. NP1]|uniref:VOC family protein n=1 Tax=Bradyrhizobium sp. NP1 TaxID=3049772 RepID=UPI0025A56A6E|nr:VOC family protein [Bradyrhizobium sp. NP1]WJR80964.1 VOC family protein [Bradyrhizobium sp. NP1]
MADHPIAEIDHLLTYVRDLDAAASLFRRMGFTLSPISRIEPMGISNHLVLMQPQTAGFANYIELMASHDRTRLPPAMVRTLSGEQGVKSMVLGARDAAAAHGVMTAAGFDAGQPVHVRRQWVIAPGESVFPEFDVILPVETPLAFNACRYYDVGLYLRPAWLSHANTARHLSGVFAIAADPARWRDEFTRLFAGGQDGRPSPGQVWLDVISAADAQSRFGAGRDLQGAEARYLGYEIAVDSIAALRACLEQGEVRHRVDGDVVYIDPEIGFGNLIVFRQHGR